MGITYPLMLSASVVSACYLRLTAGNAADILKASLGASFKTGASYPCLYVFKKPFTDQTRLKAAFLELAEEVGMACDKVDLVFEAEVPAGFPTDNAVENDHYVDKGWNMFKRAWMTMGGWHAYVQVFNGKEGEPTVLRAFLPGHTFDGTSCFNITKELISRYYGTRNEIVVPTELNDSTAEVHIRIPDVNSKVIPAVHPYGATGAGRTVVRRLPGVAAGQRLHELRGLQLDVSQKHAGAGRAGHEHRADHVKP